jgi:predicted molibdopterin-dependent oxidoreductase YjgC
MKRISLTIDGRKVEIDEGRTVLEAARQYKIFIPTLCSHPALKPFGACRLCIVQIDGIGGFPTACTMPAEDGMVVRTDTEEIKEMRLDVLELILSEHPAGCLLCDYKEKCEGYQECIRKVGVVTGCKFCPKSGRCGLQYICQRLGIDKLKERMMKLPTIYRGFEVEKHDPFFERNYNLCILCGQCVRVCQDIRGAGVLTFVYRGPRAIVGTAFGRSHLESECQFCGACVDVCPTGALIDRTGKWDGVPDYKVETTCPYCASGCTINLEVKDGKVIRSKPKSFSEICSRGRFGIAYFIHSPLRFTKPMIRENGAEKLVSWDEVIQFATENLKKYKGKVGIVLSPQLTNEDIYVIAKLAKVLGVRNLAARFFKDPKECNSYGTGVILKRFNFGLKPTFKRVKLLWAIGKIPKVPDKTDFIILQDFFPSDNRADIVLPSCTFAETDGTFINKHGIARRIRKAINSIGDSKPDWWIICEVAKRMGFEGFDYTSFEQITDEMAGEIPEFEGMSEGKKCLKRKLLAPLYPYQLTAEDVLYSYRGFELIKQSRGFRRMLKIEG